MGDLRYAQFCPLARAAELLGERWTLLILRELFLGPQRFSDLRRRLGEVSSSVLAERLERLERRGVVARRKLPPPAASVVYELAPAGEALRPALEELMRWGARFLVPPRPGDRLEPDWVRLALRVFARREETPQRRFEIRLGAGSDALVLRASGGPHGTRVEEGPGDADVSLRVEPLLLLGLVAGRVCAERALREGRLEASGDLAALSELPALFHVDFGGASDPAASSTPKGDS